MPRIIIRPCVPRLARRTFGPLLMALLGVYLLFQWPLAHYTEWADESETVVASKLLAHGERLYSEVFNNHGPLTFLCGFLIEKVGDFSVPGHRMPVIALQLAIFASIFACPLLLSRYAKALAAIILGLFFLFLIPKYLGHTNQYDILAGCLLTLTLYIYLAPAILDPAALTPGAVAMGSFLIGSTAFLAVTYWPSLLLLYFSALRREHIQRSLAWLALALLANLAFLAFIGSLRGYIAEHLYFNLVILAPFMGTTLWGSAWAIVKALFFNAWVFPMLAWVAYGLVIKASGSAWWRASLALLGVVLFFMRGFGFHAMPGLYMLLGLFALSMGQALDRSSMKRTIYAGAALLVCLFILTYGPVWCRRMSSDPFPTSSEFSEFAKLRTAKGDRIIAYPFENVQYLLADRLPASGAFFFLPWQAKYNEAPVFGIKVDPCQEFRENRPKLVFIKDAVVWGRYPWQSYSSCIQECLDESYALGPGKGIYIRKDLIAQGL